MPGVTVWDLVVGRDWDGDDINQIGRQPPLSANKSATHFPILRELTRVRFDRMVNKLILCICHYQFLILSDHLQIPH